MLLSSKGVYPRLPSVGDLGQAVKISKANVVLRFGNWGYPLGKVFDYSSFGCLALIQVIIPC